jgi:hypothetical protein
MNINFRSPLCLVLAMTTVSGFCQTQPRQIKKSFLDLHSLVGTWSMSTKKAVFYETWQKINDSTLMGRSYQVNGKDTVTTEQVQLIMRGDSIRYIPTVNENNNNPVLFTLVKLEKGSYTFENKEHDFPQRIIYNLPRNNLMHAWVEGNISGQFKRSDFNYKKVL